MKQKSGPDKVPAEQVLKDIRRQTRRQYSAEEKIRIVLEGLRGEESISELCRREGIAASMYYGWSKEFLEAGKRRLAGDTGRAATSRRWWPSSPWKTATFYRWYDRCREGGPEALADHRSRPDRVWNRIPDNVRRQIIDLALEVPELSPRELAVRFTDEEKYFVSEASVYRLLKAHDLITSPAYVVIKAANVFKDKTTAIDQLWQTDFTYLKITGWGWYYLSTVLDDFSRYIVAWRLGPTMRASDATATLDQALATSGLDQATVMHRPRLLSDNGASYVAGDLAPWLEDRGMEHVRGAPYHPQTQGKIERWHQTLKNRILLENYYLPEDLERQIDAFVEHYNHARYHESIDNLTPADVYFGRAEMILAERQRIKRATIANRRLQHRLQAA